MAGRGLATPEGVFLGEVGGIAPVAGRQGGGPAPISW